MIPFPSCRMLACLEERLESLLTLLDRFEPEVVQEKEKKKEKERRETVREDRIQAQKEAYALRMQVGVSCRLCLPHSPHPVPRYHLLRTFFITCSRLTCSLFPRIGLSILPTHCRLARHLTCVAFALQVSLARSQAPVQRRTGKPIMFRSAPFKVKEKKVAVDPEKEQELRDMKFFN